MRRIQLYIEENERLREQLAETQRVLQFADGHSLAQTGYILANLYASDCEWAQRALAQAGCHPRTLKASRKQTP